MPRGLLIFALCLPLAVLLGFMLADPMMGSNMMVVGGAIFALVIPILLAIHQRALIWLTGAFINAFFLPGQPQIWMVISALSFTIIVLSRPLRKVKSKPVWDKASLFCLTLFIAAVMFTAMRSGGIGLRVMGSSVYGGRKYVMLLASFVGFLAITFQSLPRKFAQKDLTIWSLAPATSAISNIAYMLGPSFYFLFLLFPVEMVLNQVHADMSPAFDTIKRLTGFSNACTALCMFCLLRWGIRGMFDSAKPWRVGLLVVALAMGMLSGFRSAILIPAVVMLAQFVTEGLHKTRYAVVAGGLAVASIIFLGAFAESLPLAAQRAVSFLPVRVDPVAAMDAKTSLNWRIDMWKTVVREIPNHLWLGKGYAIDPTDIYLADESMRRGFASDYEMSVRTGDYHNGPLSVLVPFGVVGGVTLTLFLIFAVRALYRNYRYGDAEIQNINTFLFSYFIGQLVYFVIFFGAIEAHLWVFVSTLGINLAINGGVKTAPQQARAPMEMRRGKLRSKEEPELVPA